VDARGESRELTNTIKHDGRPAVAFAGESPGWPREVGTEAASDGRREGKCRARVRQVEGHQRVGLNFMAGNTHQARCRNIARWTTAVAKGT